MTTYVGIAAVRIQPWLMRTAGKLAYLRGASQALSVETSAEHICSWLRQTGHGTEVKCAQEAGDVDGVVVLCSPHRQAAHNAGRDLVRFLRGRLPAVEFEMWIQDAGDYLSAYSQHELAGGNQLVSLPVLTELGFLRSCEFCRAEPATTTCPDGPAERRPTGADCLVRHRHQQQTRERERANPSQPRSWSRDIPGEWPENFNVLAARGGLLPRTGTQSVGRKDSRSHLATIAADGNQIGQLFTRIARHGGGLPRLRQDAVATLDECTRDAVIQAAQQFGPAEIKVVIPHYVGGDDVLLSVPAAAAWQFAIVLGETFERELKHRLQQCLSSYPNPPAPQTPERELWDAMDAVGLGIGIAFAPRAYPIAGTADLAHRALHAAKRATKGQESAIGWVDLTYSNKDIHTIEVYQARKDLEPGNRPQVFGLSPNARATLASFCTTERPDLGTIIKNWERRTGSQAGALPEDLPALLSRARWWPDVAEDEEG